MCDGLCEDGLYEDGLCEGGLGEVGLCDGDLCEGGSFSAGGFKDGFGGRGGTEKGKKKYVCLFVFFSLTKNAILPNHSHSQYGLETRLKSLFYLFVRLYADLCSVRGHLYFSIMKELSNSNISVQAFNRAI